MRRRWHYGAVTKQAFPENSGFGESAAESGAEPGRTATRPDRSPGPRQTTNHSRNPTVFPPSSLEYLVQAPTESLPTNTARHRLRRQVHRETTREIHRLRIVGPPRLRSLRRAIRRLPSGVSTDGRLVR